LRTPSLVVLGFLAIVAVPSPSYAASAGVLRTEIGPSPNVVEVDRRCDAGCLGIEIGTVTGSAVSAGRIGGGNRTVEANATRPLA
jgi:hypothetical protein